MTCARSSPSTARQRPDLAIRKFAERLLRGKAVPVSATDRRSATHLLDDLVEGWCARCDRDLGFALLNFAGGRTVTVLEVVAALERELGVTAEIDWQPESDRRRSSTWATSRGA